MSESDVCIVNDNIQFMDKYSNGIPLIELIPFYENVARNDPFKLDWVCPGRINPKPQQEKPTVLSENDKSPKTKAPDPSPVTVKMKEFDFDEAVNHQQANVFSSIPSGPASQNSSLPIRRIAGNTRPPPRQPRVANMDKILNDFFKTRKEPNLPLTCTFETLPTNTITTVSEVTPSIDIPLYTVSPSDAKMVSTTTSSNEPVYSLECFQRDSLVNGLSKASISSPMLNPQLVTTNVVKFVMNQDHFESKLNEGNITNYNEPSELVHAQTPSNLNLINEYPSTTEKPVNVNEIMQE